MRDDIPQGDIRCDAAAANMEAPWRMFTQTQGQELISNTTYQWTTMNEVNGWKFASKSNSSKYIFLPAAGYLKDTSYKDASSYGLYWCTEYANSSSAWYMLFDPSSVRMNYFDFYPGYSIRGIQ